MKRGVSAYTAEWNTAHEARRMRDVTTPTKSGSHARRSLVSSLRSRFSSSFGTDHEANVQLRLDENAVPCDRVSLVPRIFAKPGGAGVLFFVSVERHCLTVTQ